MRSYEYTLKATGGAEFIFPVDFGIYLSIIIPSISIQSTGFHTTQTYTPSNDGCFHKLSLLLQKYMNYLVSSLQRSNMFYLDTIIISGTVAPGRTERYGRAGEIKGS
jgi:hypothetical protein